MPVFAALRLLGALIIAGAMAATPVSAQSVTAANGKPVPAEAVGIGGHWAHGGRVIARLAGGERMTAQELSRAEERLSALGLEEKARSALVPGLRVLQLKKTAANRATAAPDLKQQIAALRASGLFQYVEPDWLVHATATPTDGAFTNGTLWGLRNTGQSGGTSGADINAVAAWDLTTGSAQVVIGVIDSGIRHTHQDLAANMWVNPGEIAGNGIDDDNNGYVDDVHGINAITGAGDPMDDNDHGTHCAGTIAAVGNGGGPLVGVAWNARLMGLKFLAADGSGYTSDAIESIGYAVAKGADILSNSWGGGGYSQGLRDAIAAAHNAGVLFVAAAGNEGANNDNTPSYPANSDVPNVISVAALDRNDQLAGFSNYGASTVDLGAPGVSIYSSTASSDTSYASFSGTSMATPHVSGVAALILSRFPGSSPTDLKQRLLNNTRPVSALSGRTVTGGSVDAYAALQAAADGILELRAAASRNPLAAGQNADFYITVSDSLPVTDATVTARLDGAAATTFRDNGAAPDQQAGDGIYSATLTVPEGVSTTQLSVEASAPGKQAASDTFSFNVATPPDNDHFADRTVIAAGVTRSIGSNQEATSEPGEPNAPSTAGGKSVWWSWTAPSSATATITTSGSDFDTVLAVYSGSSLGTLSLIGANDDAIGLQSSVSFTPEAGVTYAIRVDGYAGAAGSITLNHPAPGSVSDAPVITSEPQDTTVLVGESFALTVGAGGASPLSYQWYKDGGLLSGANAATYSVASASLGDAGGYRVDVSNTFGSQTSRTATVTVEQVVLRPANDNFAQAEALPGSSGRVTDIGVNLATGENGEPNHAGASEPLTSVWWRWTAPASGQLNLNTFGSDFDTTLAVYTGDSLATLSEITANDDTDGLQSSVSLAATAGQTYSIAVDGYDDNAGSAVLNYALTTGAAPTDNDLFADRQDIPFGTLSVTGSNIGAGGESGEPSHAGASNPLASVWWSWQPAQNVEVSIDTANSDYDTTLAVYLGDRVDALSLVASNDDAIGLQSQVSFQAQGGLSYAIAVDGYGTSEGNIALNLDHAAGDCETGPVLITDMLFTDLNLIRSETRIETDGSVELSAGADVTFESGGDIVLGNGFTVQPGAVFAARLGDVVCAQALGGKGGAETEATQKRRGTPEPQVVGPAVPLPAGLKALSASGALWYLNADAGGRQFVFVTEQRLNDRDRNGVADVYLYDTATDIHRPLSVTAWGETGNGPSDQPRIDRLGRFVVFRSLADNLDDSGDGNDGADVFLTELAGHGLQRIADGTFGLRSRPASHPDVGGDGPFVVFLRTGADGRHELHGHDPRWRESPPLVLPSECDANAPGISADGRYIAVKCDEDETRSVFHVIDRVSGRRGSTICPETLREQSLWPRFREGNRLIEWHPAGKAPYTGAVYTIQNPLAAPGPAP